jgi:Rps23 Pro-64 3,4-dihydroxylase Tpa1-like proline 4-hydroxylase
MKSLVDYIQIFDNVVVDDWILNEIQSLDSLYIPVDQTLETKNHGKYNYLKLEKYESIPDKSFEKLFGPFQMGLVQAVDMYSRVVNEFVYSDLSGSESFLLTKYQSGDYVVKHSDYFPIKARSLSLHLTLNEEFEGGEFSFFNGEHIIKPKKNQIIIFPANFIFNYEIFPVTSGIRWAAENWTN